MLKVSSFGIVFFLVAGVDWTESSEIVLIGWIKEVIEFYPCGKDTVF